MSISITPNQQPPIALTDSPANSGAGQGSASAAPASADVASAEAGLTPTDQIAAHAGLVAQASQSPRADAGAAPDLNGDGARLLALQVRQQLSAHTLSIANQAPQALLSLLR